MRISFSERNVLLHVLCIAHFVIYFLSLFYIYQPERFADRKLFSFQLNFLQHFSPLTGPRHGRLGLQSGRRTPDTHGSIIGRRSITNASQRVDAKVRRHASSRTTCRGHRLAVRDRTKFKQSTCIAHSRRDQPTRRKTEEADAARSHAATLCRRT